MPELTLILVNKSEVRDYFARFCCAAYTSNSILKYTLVSYQEVIRPFHRCIITLQSSCSDRKPRSRFPCQAYLKLMPAFTSSFKFKIEKGTMCVHLVVNKTISPSHLSGLFLAILNFEPVPLHVAHPGVAA